MELVKPKTRRWTYDEYYKMAEPGWFAGQRVELIEGEIIEMSPQGEDHARSVSLTGDVLRDAFGRGFWVRQQLPLLLGGDTEPDPDVAVVKGAPREHADRPRTALLIVEVSETSLGYDRYTRPSLYAREGIGDYWIVNLVDRQLEVHRDPVPDAEWPHRYRYADVRILTANETVSPLAAPQATVAVRDLLP